MRFFMTCHHFFYDNTTHFSEDLILKSIIEIHKQATFPAPIP